MKKIVTESFQEFETENGMGREENMGGQVSINYNGENFIFEMTESASDDLSKCNDCHFTPDMKAVLKEVGHNRVFFLENGHGIVVIDTHVMSVSLYKGITDAYENPLGMLTLVGTDVERNSWFQLLTPHDSETVESYRFS